MDKTANTTKKQNTQARANRYGDLTDVPGAKVDKEQLNQSMVP